MAQVHPFRALRYNPARAAFDRVLTQPYDKISPAMQEKYYAADPHNLIAVERGRVFPEDSPQNNVYTRAAGSLEGWIRDNVVVQDSAPAFYGYTQEYAVPGSEERRTRRGFIGAGKLEEYAAGVVFRHEQTLHPRHTPRACPQSMPRVLCFATSKHFPARKRTGWSCCGALARIPDNSSCCTRTRSGASMRFYPMRKLTRLRLRSCATNMA